MANGAEVAINAAECREEEEGWWEWLTGRR